MASSNKTSHLNLNQWSGADKPKRADFNNDNSIIDTALGEHLINTDIHVISADKQPHYIGSYMGTGSLTKAVSVPFRPSAVFVTAADNGLMGYTNADNKLYAYSGFGTREYVSAGITLSETGFTVQPTSTAIAGNTYASLNKGGTYYIFIAFR